MSVTSDVPNRSSASARSRAATREQLLASGVALFAEKGLHGVTTHDVAHAAGFAAGTFYLHFKDKQELFKEIAFEAIGDLRVQLSAAAATATSLRDSVPRFAQALVAYAENNRDRVRIIFSVDRASVDVESDLLSELATAIADGRRRWIASGDMPTELDPVVMSQALVGMWARVIAWWIEDPGRTSRDTLIQTLTAIQLAGTHPQTDRA
jgi:AcrR family transcriptional regulator